MLTLGDLRRRNGGFEAQIPSHDPCSAQVQRVAHEDDRGDLPLLSKAGELLKTVKGVLSGLHSGHPIRRKRFLEIRCAGLGLGKAVTLLLASQHDNQRSNAGVVEGAGVIKTRLEHRGRLAVVLGRPQDDDGVGVRPLVHLGGPPNFRSRPAEIKDRGENRQNDQSEQEPHLIELKPRHSLFPTNVVLSAEAKGAATDPQIVVLERGQAEAGAAALAASHADYPAFAHIFPDPTRRASALLPFFRATVRDAIPFGTVYAALEGEHVLGIAVWLPPGAFPWSAARKLRATGAFMKVWAADRRGFKTFTRLGANTELNHPSDTHWSLEALGVRPEAQKQGLGGRLVRPMLERADSEGIECYLETSNPANIDYYARFGFHVLSEVSLIPNGPPHVAMRRRVAAGPPG